MIISPSNSQEEGSTSSSSTQSAEMSPPAMDYFESLSKKIDEEEGDEPPPRKKTALAKQTADQLPVDGVSSIKQKFLQDELLRSLEITKLVEEENSRASHDNLDPVFHQTADEQTVHVEELKHHEAVLETVPAFPAPSLQSVQQPYCLIYGKKPTRAGKRIVSETDVPILMKHLHGSHSIDSTVDEFIGHLERTNPQDKTGKFKSIFKIKCIHLKFSFF